MTGSENDVVGGFKRTIEEQKKVKDGECIVSMYTFASDVKKNFIGKKLDEVKDLEYSPGGMTKLLDGIGTAVDEIGVWLADMPEDERPSKNLIVIITDGEENYSTEYSASRVKEMIKHQETKYNWDFVYLGSDLNNVNDAKNLGITNIACATKSDFMSNYDYVITGATKYRCAASIAEADASLKAYTTETLSAMNTQYAAKTGIDITKDNDDVQVF